MRSSSISQTASTSIRPLALPLSPPLLSLGGAAIAGTEVAAVIEVDADAEGIMVVGSASPAVPCLEVCLVHAQDARERRA